MIELVHLESSTPFHYALALSTTLSTHKQAVQSDVLVPHG